MTTITIVVAASDESGTLYWAIAPGSGLQTTGHTAGEALDALNQRLGTADSAATVIIQRQESDALFTQSQVERLRELIQRSQTGGLTPSEESERDILVESELLASAQRAAALADALGR